EKGWKSRQESKKEARFAPLERRFTPPISFPCRPLPVFRNRTLSLHGTTARPDGGQVIKTVAQWRTTMRTHDLTPFYRSTVGFDRIFHLADFVQVKNASLENGLLHVELVREIPEAKKPRSIPINSGEKAPQLVDASVAA